MHQLGITLRQLRKSRQQTQTEFGLMVGIPQSTISKLESGEQKKLTLEQFKLLEKVLGPASAGPLLHNEPEANTQMQGFEEKPQTQFIGYQAQKPSHRVERSPASAKGRHPAWGALKGTTIVLPGVDLTAPSAPEWGGPDE